MRLFQFPFDYDQGEGFELMDTVLFSQGEWPYRDNNTYPFYSSNYPPLFHVVTAPLVWLFGPHYWTGRLVSFLGTLITALAIGFGVQKAGRRWWLSALAGLAFLASNYVYHVGPLFRQHMFMVMFETVAVVLMALTIDKEEREGRQYNGRLLLVMFLLLLAGYTKQLAYATVAAVFIFWFIRQPKRAVLWAVPFAAVTGLIFLWINWSTDGWWLVNTVTANINPFIREQAIGLFRQWFTLHTVLTLVALVYAAYQFYFERLSLYSVWFGLALLNSITAGKWGAGESYFATAIAASCILTGIAFARVLTVVENREWGSTQKGFWWQTAVLSLIAILFLIQADKLFHAPTDVALFRAVAWPWANQRKSPSPHKPLAPPLALPKRSTTSILAASPCWGGRQTAPTSRQARKLRPSSPRARPRLLPKTPALISTLIGRSSPIPRSCSTCTTTTRLT
ncbi:MAG: hypothetical protein M5U34_21890 [Chloroflexi bacterium]|nr:hypothetical protein [Chloroflexota bacterium]